MNRLFFVVVLAVAAACVPRVPPDPPPAPAAPVCLAEGGPVDVLFIVDNSESLDAVTRGRLVSSLNVFLAPLLASGLDYHVGVVTSDPAEAGILRVFDGAPVDGCAACRFVTPAVACDDIDVDVSAIDRCDAWFVLANLLRAGDAGGVAEMSFDMAVAALDDAAPAANDGFRRAQAPLHIVFVSDEDEGDKQDGTAVRFYERFFEELAGIGNEALVTTSSIVGLPAEMDDATRAELCPILQTTFDDDDANDDPRAFETRELLLDSFGCSFEENPEQTAAETGGRFVELACRTGGVVADLCTTDYTRAMSELGAHVISRCVDRGECMGNVHCGEGELCDAATSSCVAEVECLRDGHCAIGSICEDAACVVGCADNADCLPDMGCIGNSFGSTGTCGFPCIESGQCRGGELCVGGECVADPRGPCQPCSASCELPSQCRTDSRGFSYCAPDCSAGEECPARMVCRDTIITPPSAPFCTFPETCEGGQCSRTSASCVVDEDCPEGSPGGDCHIQTSGRFGSCALDANINCTDDVDCAEGDTCVVIECRGAAGASFGQCTCSRDSDCPVDVCIGADLSDPGDPVAGHCELSGRTCFDSFECDVIACVAGGCRIGASCVPADDEPCSDFLSE